MSALHRSSRRLLAYPLLICGLILAMAIGTLARPPRALAVSANIVVSQVYGGGGNAGATYTNDFIELFNRGATTINVTGWSVQYAAAAGTSWQVTNLTGSIAPGQYYLVQEAVGAGGMTPLPAPDATGIIPMSATAGKVALVNSTTALTGSGCPFSASIVDFVGFGTTANCFEGTAPTPAPSNTAAVLRASGGCIDTDSNSADFSSGAPNPRNTSSALNPCGGPTATPTATGTNTPTPLFTATPTAPATITPTPGPTTHIYDIQGASHRSPLVGQSVSNVPGIVIAKTSNGFYMQDSSGDGNDATSDGIFVFTSSA